MVKVIEFGYHELVVDIDELHRREMGIAIESSPFVVGGFSFTLLFYPGGADPAPHAWEATSVFIKNHTPKPVQLVYHVHAHTPLQYYEICDSLSSRDRETYHELAIVEPRSHFGRLYFNDWTSLCGALDQDKELRIRATIGVVLDPPPPRPLLASSFETCILFQVGAEAQLHYVEESVVTRLCPSLLLSDSDSDSNHIVRISDVEPHVFKAVLWFVINKKLHKKDRKLIANKKDLFGPKMLAAAARFNLKDLTRQCQSFMSHGDSEALVSYYELELDIKEVWENVWRLPQKIMELILIPHKKSA